MPCNLVDSYHSHCFQNLHSHKITIQTEFNMSVCIHKNVRTLFFWVHYFWTSSFYFLFLIDAVSKMTAGHFLLKCQYYSMMEDIVNNTINIQFQDNLMWVISTSTVTQSPFFLKIILTKWFKNQIRKNLFWHLLTSFYSESCGLTATALICPLIHLHIVCQHFLMCSYRKVSLNY
jgi:hypothetical protein